MKRFILFLLMLIVYGNAYAQRSDDIAHAIKTLDSLNNHDEFVQSENLARKILKQNPSAPPYHHAVLNYYIGYALRFNGSDSSIYYLNQALFYAQKAKNKTVEFDALESLCEQYCNKSGYELQRDQTAQALKTILDTAKNPRLLGKLYSVLSTYYSVVGNHEMQVNYDIKSLDIGLDRIKNRQLNTNDSANLMVAYSRVGESYIDLQQFEKAIEYILAARTYLPTSQPSLMAYYYRDMAISLTYMNKLTTVHQYADSILRLKRLPNAIVSDVDDNYNIIYLTLADHFLQQKKADSALFFLHQMLKITDSSAVNPYVINALNLATGKALMLKKNFEGALPYFKQSEAMFESMKKTDYVLVLKNIAECYAGLNQWENATKYYQLYVPLSDTLYNQAAKQSIATAEARFQNKEKQAKINTQQLQLSYAHKQRIALIVGLGLAGLAIVLLGIIYRNKKRNADLLAAKNKALDEANATKAKLFSIIGHDLRSPINQVYQFLKLQQRSSTRITEAEKQELSNNIQTATGALLETMEDLLLWSKTQLSAFSINTQAVIIANELAHSLGLLQLNINAKALTIENKVSATMSLYTDPHFLQIILRNLIQNAIKAAAQNSTITITSTGNSICIANEGADFSQNDYEKALADYSKAFSGMGLKLVDELSRKIGATIKFSNNDGKTNVTIAFPNN